MLVDTKYIVSMTEANQNFSKVAKMTEEMGQVIIFKNNKPRFLVVDLKTCPCDLEIEDEEKFDRIANKILTEHRGVLEKLAKY